ncbi:hormogonium polysaccharide biosynthesis glycosyltransferase HpsE [Leptolyngbya sp. DQ-M1]|uniref:hormogonium polysaccharide biosynthesis glycosyltransferase HpsE n=1 Tax=Leptolyngbya sp. DQ-M1 TaxID=2933920 RepID=UPI00329739BD
MLPLDFTVAIRAFNAADRLPALLDKLQSQQNTESIRWEVLIVDNNSTDNTAEVVQAYQSKWKTCDLRYVLERKQGAAIARWRAIQEAKGAFIGFLDDDNLPAEDWVATASAFGRANPKVGAYGSQIHGIFEVEPPQNIRRIALYFPIIERKNLLHFDTYKKGLPPGAGLTIRKQAWLDHVPENLIFQGPVKGSLATKWEDIEALHHMRNVGWEVWYNPEMHIYHYIPKWRLEAAYLLKFLKSTGLSQHRFRMLGYPVWQRPLVFPLLLLNDLRKIVSHKLKHRGSKDLVAACELQFLIGRFLSPFHIWTRLLTQGK